jgi:hypothetical protein
MYASVMVIPGLAAVSGRRASPVEVAGTGAHRMPEHTAEPADILVAERHRDRADQLARDKAHHRLRERDLLPPIGKEHPDVGMQAPHKRARRLASCAQDRISRASPGFVATLLQPAPSGYSTRAARGHA